MLTGRTALRGSVGAMGESGFRGLTMPDAGMVSILGVVEGDRYPKSVLAGTQGTVRVVR